MPPENSVDCPAVAGHVFHVIDQIMEKSSTAELRYVYMTHLPGQSAISHVGGGGAVDEK